MFKSLLYQGKFYVYDKRNSCHRTPYSFMSNRIKLLSSRARAKYNKYKRRKEVSNIPYEFNHNGSVCVMMVSKERLDRMGKVIIPICN